MMQMSEFRWTMATLAVIIITWALSTVSLNDTNKNKVMDLPETKPVQMSLISLPAPPPIKTEAQHSSSAGEQPSEQVLHKDMADTVSDTQYQEVLNDLQTAQLTLAMPQDKQQRERLLEHLYRCQNLQFGVLNYTNGQPQIELLTKQSTLGASQLIRIVDGPLATREQNMLKAYAAKGQAIRIFHQDMDNRLAYWVKQTIGQQSLTQLRARYRLQQGEVSLVQIMVNDRLVQASWPLSKNRACV